MDFFPFLAPFAGIGMASVLGLLIGVERGWSHREDMDGSRVAGIRTFALLGLTGGIAGELSARVSPLIGAALIAGAGAALVVGYARNASADDLSATTTVAGLVTLGLGALAAVGETTMAGALAAVTMVVLTQRRRLHAWIGSLSGSELQAIARFGLISLAILPLLPNRNMGPLDAWNPQQIWLVVVLVSGLSLVAYAMSRSLDAAKGLLVTAGIGAIVSSTAVTVALAARAREASSPLPSITAGIALASATMFIRVLVLVALLAPSAFASLAIVAAPAAIVSASFVLLAMRRQAPVEASGSEAALHNPFDLAPALILAGLVMVVSWAGRWALQEFGDAGLATVLGISGMVDVDAAIISMRGLPAGSLTRLEAGLVLSAPILTNTLLKAALTIAIARNRAGWVAATPLLASLIAGLIGAALLPQLH